MQHLSFLCLPYFTYHNILHAYHAYYVYYVYHAYYHKWQDGCVYMCMHVCITFPLSIHSLVDPWYAFICWLLWVILQWRWEFRYLFAIAILFLLTTYPEVGWLDHMIVLCSIFLRKLNTIFHSGYTNLHSHNSAK